MLSHALFGTPHSKSPEEHNGCLERDTEVARHKRAKLAEPVEEVPHLGLRDRDVGVDEGGHEQE